jgi:outer membrane protein assembly factor BamB
MTTRGVRRHFTAASALGIAAAAAVLLVPQWGVAAEPAGAVAIGATDWAAYEHGPAHSSTQVNDTAITTSNAAALLRKWTFTAGPASVSGQPGPGFDSSPSVVNGVVYIGSRTGEFYALNASTGAVLWHRQLDYGSNTTCPAKGIVGTATVAADPVTGALTVYAPGAHTLYALSATTGTVVWKRAIGPATAAGEATYFNWSSPTVIKGHVYMGLAAKCESHLIRGGVVELSQHTGALQHSYYAVPAGRVGASVWSSVASDGTSVWVTTGNPDPTGTSVYQSFSIVRLSAATLAVQDIWTVPTAVTVDLDFGSSPTLFPAVISGVSTNLVAACNKNGVFYAWNRQQLSPGPVWQFQAGQTGGTGTGACITSAAYSAPTGQMFVAANQTTLAGVSHPGSLRSIDPATGTASWTQPLGCMPNGSPTVDVTTQVLAVPLYGPCAGAARPGVALYDASSGSLLTTLVTAGKEFAQPVFAEGKLFVADESGVLAAYGP